MTGPKGSKRVDAAHEVIDVEVPSQSPPTSSRGDEALATDATRSLALASPAVLYGSRAFFSRAAEELLQSTRSGRELAGSVLARRVGGRVLLEGLMRNNAGAPGRVGIDTSWGSLLWHTHPGLRGSLAAFSLEDLDVARSSQKPLLVIGFGGLSPDVLSTLSLPMGGRSFVASASLKAVMALEKRGMLPERLLLAGVAVRVCWPDGTIRPVVRQHATALEAAWDDMSFVVDRSVGAIERTGQRALREVLHALVPGKKP